MNTLTLCYRDYCINSYKHPTSTFWVIEFFNDSVGDADCHDHLTKIDMETLRDNAKRLYESLDKTLKEHP